jgi:hypothetical protein
METWLKVTIGAILLFILAIIINFLVGTISGTFSNEELSVPASDSPIKILSQSMEKDDDGNLFIVGRAQNIINSKINYTEINAEFYNQAGNMITKSFDKKSDLEANQTWNFMIPYNGVASYEVASYNISVGNTW